MSLRTVQLGTTANSQGSQQCTRSQIQSAQSRVQLTAKQAFRDQALAPLSNARYPLTKLSMRNTIDVRRAQFPTIAPSKACILDLPYLDREDAAGQDCPRWRNAAQAKRYLHCSGILDEIVESVTMLPLARITARLVYSPGRGTVQLSWLLQSKSPCALETATEKIASIWCNNLLGAHPETLYLEGSECDIFRTHFLDRKRARSDDEIFIVDVAMERQADRFGM